MRLGISKSKNTINYYIIKDYTRNGKRSTKIVEKIGNLDEVVKKAGNKDHKIWLKEYLDNFNQEISSDNQVIKIEKYSNKLIPKNMINSFNIGYLFLSDIYHDLKINDICTDIQKKYDFKFNLSEVFSCLIYSRIIYPSSKLKTFELSENHLEKPSFELHDVYRALSYISKETDYIQEKLFKNSLSVTERNSNVIYYDCTNYFFEINTEDELRKYGISKQHQPSPLVGMGLFMDGDGLPIAFNIFPGNRNEQETLIPTETKIVENFKTKDTQIILCTDAGLASDKIKAFNIENNRAFVITQSIKKLKENYQDVVFDNNDWRIIGDLKNTYNIKDIAEDGTFRKIHYDTLFYKIIPTETKSVKQDLIVTFSFKYLDYKRNIRDAQILRATKAITANTKIKKTTNQNDYKRFITEITSTNDGEVAENTNYTINQDLIDEEAKYDGYYGVTTNLTGDVSKILKIVKNRWEIEESFRIMKSDFNTRPIHLSREDRIKAHFTSCFLALFIYRVLEKKLSNKYTTTEILECLRTMSVTELKGDGYIPSYRRTNLTDDLHEIFGFNTDFEINTYKNFKKILDKIKR